MQVNGATMPFSQNVGADGSIGRLKKQLEQLKKQIELVEKNDALTQEEKTKQILALEQQVAAVNQQLSKEQSQTATANKQSQLDVMTLQLGGDNSKSGGVLKMSSSGLDTTAMNSLLAAGTSFAQAKATATVSRKMASESRMLESEIKQDKMIGADTSRKEERLAELKAKADETRASSMSSMKAISKGDSSSSADGIIEMTEKRLEEAEKEKDEQKPALPNEEPEVEGLSGDPHAVNLLV